MKRTLSAILGLVLWQTSCAFGAQIDNAEWNTSNVTKLNKVDKAAVADFINKVRGPDAERLKSNEIAAFKWVDLAGDGGCELVVETSYPAVSWVTIYWREKTGDFKSQSIMGETNFNNGIRDLNGDGSKEIIVRSYLDPAGRHAADKPTPLWPQVYRLENGKYVPASNEFASFYDLEVLPKLDREIAKPRQLEPSEADPLVAALEMQRDKIERVLGRDPNAGLGQAQQWARSRNPELIDDAIIVLRDIGGHGAEINAAEHARKRALEHPAAKQND